MKSHWAFLVGLSAILVLVFPMRPALSEPVEFLAAPMAYEMAQSGALLILDVRSPEEWKATGIPAGAKAVTIHDPGGLKGFATKAAHEIGRDRDRPVALICASGNRSTKASAILAQIGYTNIFNIQEGMMGRNDTAHPMQKGWIKHGLPVEPPK